MPPAEPGSEPTIPQWAASLAVSVEGIKARTDQIPKLIEDLEKLRAAQVPIGAHLKLVGDVDTLKERDLGARTEWEEMTRRVPILWEERTVRAGAHAAHRLWLAVLSTIVTALTIFTLLHNLGIGFSIGNPAR